MLLRGQFSRYCFVACRIVHGEFDNRTESLCYIDITTLQNAKGKESHGGLAGIYNERKGVYKLLNTKRLQQRTFVACLALVAIQPLRSYS